MLHMRTTFRTSPCPTPPELEAVVPPTRPCTISKRVSFGSHHTCTGSPAAKGSRWCSPAFYTRATIFSPPVRPTILRVSVPERTALLTVPASAQRLRLARKGFWIERRALSPHGLRQPTRRQRS